MNILLLRVDLDGLVGLRGDTCPDGDLLLFEYSEIPSIEGRLSTIK